MSVSRRIRQRATRICSFALYGTSLARLYQPYGVCETCTGGDRFHVKGLSQRLAEVSKSWTYAEIYSCA